MPQGSIKPFPPIRHDHAAVPTKVRRRGSIVLGYAALLTLCAHLFIFWNFKNHCAEN